MFEEVLTDLYRIEVPLPRNPLKSINSYVIKSYGRNLIIDTGMNRKECLNAMNLALKELKIDLRETDFFITHLHADHCGLISTLKKENSTIYCSQPDANIINSTNFWDRMLKFASISGFPEQELQNAIKTHPGYKYNTKGHLDFNIIKEGDTINIGDYLFKCIETPGHTKGHMCLYEPDRKILVSGDHIIKDITPNISLWSDEDDPLDEYLKSLDKVYKFDVEIVLPGHRRLFKDLKERIRQLKHHHYIRSNEILNILEKGEKDAYQVASQMKWDLTYDSWEQFPVQQKWFATGEAMAHLKYLEGKGKIQKKENEQKLVFLLN